MLREFLQDVLRNLVMDTPIWPGASFYGITNIRFLAHRNERIKILEFMTTQEAIRHCAERPQGNSSNLC